MASGYRFLWIQVTFDIPVKTKLERKWATKFRTSLLDLGFDMVQYSVYMKWVVGKEAANSVITRICMNLPNHGNVHILLITDKQYEKIISFIGKKSVKTFQNPEQLSLF